MEQAGYFYFFQHSDLITRWWSWIRIVVFPPPETPRSAWFTALIMSCVCQLAPDQRHRLRQNHADGLRPHPDQFAHRQPAHHFHRYRRGAARCHAVAGAVVCQWHHQQPRETRDRRRRSSCGAYRCHRVQLQPDAGNAFTLAKDPVTAATSVDYVVRAITHSGQDETWIGGTAKPTYQNALTSFPMTVPWLQPLSVPRRQDDGTSSNDSKHDQ